MATTTCTCTVPERMAETPDDAALCAYCGGLIPAPTRTAPVYEYRTTRHRIAELPAPIRAPRDAVAALQALLGDRETEGLAVLALSTKNRPIAAELVYAGNVSASQVRVGELFRLAVRMNATSIILGHNHPSGDPTPSPDDLHLTAEAIASGRLLDIEVLDHLIVTDDPERFVSLRDRGVDFSRPTRGIAEAPAEYGACPYGGTTADECATIRERAAAGTSDPIAACPVHGAHPDDEPDDGAVLIAGVLYDAETGEEIDDTPDDCPDCGHPEDAHADNACAACDDLAQVGQYAPCATVDPAPWDDDDDRQLAESMKVAAWSIGGLWTGALARADRWRRDAVAAAGMSADEIANVAALFGIVPDPRNEDAGQRVRELGDVWAAARRAYDGDFDGREWGRSAADQRPYEAADGFEERQLVAGFAIPGRPLTVAQWLGLTQYHHEGAILRGEPFPYKGDR